MRLKIAITLLCSLFGISIATAQFHEIVHDSLTDRSKLKDLSLTLPWSTHGMPKTAFKIGDKQDNNGLIYKAISLHDSLTASQQINYHKYENTLKASTCIDYHFPRFHRDQDTIQVEFDALWSNLNNSGESGRINVIWLHETPDTFAYNVTDSINMMNPFGRPAYHFRARNRTIASATGFLAYSGGDETLGRFYKHQQNGKEKHWLPGAVPNHTKGSGAYPNGSYLNYNTKVASADDWMHFTFVLYPEKIVLKSRKSKDQPSSDRTVAQMAIPKDGAGINEPLYHWFESVNGVRIFVNGQGTNAYFANIKVSGTKHAQAKDKEIDLSKGDKVTVTGQHEHYSNYIFKQYVPDSQRSSRVATYQPGLFDAGLHFENGKVNNVHSNIKLKNGGSGSYFKTSPVLGVKGAGTEVIWNGNFISDGGESKPSILLRDSGKVIFAGSSEIDLILQGSYFTRQFWVHGDGTGVFELAKDYVADLTKRGAKSYGNGSLRFSNTTFISHSTQSLPMGFRPNTSTGMADINAHLVFENAPGSIWKVKTQPQEYLGGLWTDVSMSIDTEYDLTLSGKATVTNAVGGFYTNYGGIMLRKENIVITKTGKANLMISGNQGYGSGALFDLKEGSLEFQSDPYELPEVPTMGSMHGKHLSVKVSANASAFINVDTAKLVKLDLMNDASLKIISNGQLMADTLMLNGNLEVIISAQAQAGDTAFIFKSNNISGRFASITSSGQAGLKLNTSKLYTDGYIIFEAKNSRTPSRLLIDEDFTNGKFDGHGSGTNGDNWKIYGKSNHVKFYPTHQRPFAQALSRRPTGGGDAWEGAQWYVEKNEGAGLRDDNVEEFLVDKKYDVVYLEFEAFSDFLHKNEHAGVEIAMLEYRDSLCGHPDYCHDLSFEAKQNFYSSIAGSPFHLESNTENSSGSEAPSSAKNAHKRGYFNKTELGNSFNNKVIWRNRYGLGKSNIEQWGTVDSSDYDVSKGLVNMLDANNPNAIFSYVQVTFFRNNDSFTLLRDGVVKDSATIGIKHLKLGITKVADFNVDYKVDAADYQILKANDGKTKANLTTGDANNDGVTNAKDALLYYGLTDSISAQSQASTSAAYDSMSRQIKVTAAAIHYIEIKTKKGTLGFNAAQVGTSIDFSLLEDPIVIISNVNGFNLTDATLGITFPANTSAKDLSIRVNYLGSQSPEGFWGKVDGVPLVLEKPEEKRMTVKLMPMKDTVDEGGNITWELSTENLKASDKLRLQLKSSNTASINDTIIEVTGNVTQQQFTQTIKSDQKHTGDFSLTVNATVLAPAGLAWVSDSTFTYSIKDKDMPLASKDTVWIGFEADSIKATEESEAFKLPLKIKNMSSNDTIAIALKVSPVKGTDWSLAMPTLLTASKDTSVMLPGVITDDSDDEGTEYWTIALEWTDASRAHKFVGNSSIVLAISDNDSPISSLVKEDGEWIAFYPNPVRDGRLHIKNSELLSNIRVYGLDGKALLETSDIAAEIDISSLHSGVYIIEGIENDGTSLIKSLLIVE